MTLSKMNIKTSLSPSLIETAVQIFLTFAHIEYTTTSKKSSLLLKFY